MNGEKVICRRFSDGVLVDIPHTFDLEQIAESGQCFRLTPLQDGGYVAVTGNKLVKISPYKEGGYIFHCTFADFRDVWIPYFDLETDYSAYQQRMIEDPFLKSAIEVGGGIRILRQDLWEMAVTFVISQRNNIPRIRKAVDALCQNYGTRLGEIDGQIIYSFPTAEQLKGKDLSVASLGYREDYIRELIEYDNSVWENLRVQDDTKAKKILMGMQGIGEKVSNCIMLFGLHRMSSYPRDVWINRLIDDVYHGQFDTDQYSGFAGYVQQLQFYYYRKITREANE